VEDQSDEPRRETVEHPAARVTAVLVALYWRPDGAEELWSVRAQGGNVRPRIVIMAVATVLSTTPATKCQRSLTVGIEQ